MADDFRPTTIYHVELFEGRWWILDVAADSQVEAIAKATQIIDEGEWLQSESETAVPWDYTVPVPEGYRWGYRDEPTAGHGFRKDR